MVPDELGTHLGQPWAQWERSLYLSEARLRQVERP